MTTRIRQNGLKLLLFDHLIVWFCALMILANLALGRPLASRMGSILFYLSVAVIVLLIARYFSDSESGWRHLIRLLYPVLLFTFMYRQMGANIFLIFDHFLDPQLTAFEKSILGVNPTLYIDRHLLNVPTTEILSAAYFLYYLLIPVFFVAAYYKGRFEMIKTSMAAVCLTFVMSYILFVLYPVEGPRWFFADQYTHEVTGLIFRPMVNIVIARGAFHGGCMPSSHVAVALVIMYAVMRENRRLGWSLLFPLNVGLAAGTVWGRFHYVSDVIVGVAISVISWYVLRSYRRRQGFGDGATVTEDVSASYAS